MGTVVGTRTHGYVYPWVRVPMGTRTHEPLNEQNPPSKPLPESPNLSLRAKSGQKSHLHIVFDFQEIFVMSNFSISVFFFVGRHSHGYIS